MQLPASYYINWHWQLAVQSKELIMNRLLIATFQVASSYSSTSTSQLGFATSFYNISTIVAKKKLQNPVLLINYYLPWQTTRLGNKGGNNN